MADEDGAAGRASGTPSAAAEAADGAGTAGTDAPNAGAWQAAGAWGIPKPQSMGPIAEALVTAEASGAADLASPSMAAGAETRKGDTSKASHCSMEMCCGVQPMSGSVAVTSK